MKLLISPTNIEEAQIVAACNVDILDIKNTSEGSLGAQPPYVTKAFCDEFSGQGMILSVALGDLPNKPGTIALAAYGAVQCGAGYVKAGMYGATNYEELVGMSAPFVKAVRMAEDETTRAVVCGYADYRRIGSVSPLDIVLASHECGADIAMLDTAIKDGQNLFDALSMDELAEFTGRAAELGLKTALAGSIRAEHIEALISINADVVGVRGAVCDGNDRTKGITAAAVEEFTQYVKQAVVFAKSA